MFVWVFEPWNRDFEGIRPKVLRIHPMSRAVHLSALVNSATVSGLVVSGQIPENAMVLSSLNMGINPISCYD